MSFLAFCQFVHFDCYKPVYRNDCRNRVGFWHGGLFPHIAIQYDTIRDAIYRALKSRHKSAYSTAWNQQLKEREKKRKKYTVKTDKLISIGKRTLLRENSGSFKNKGTSLRNFVPNFGLRKFSHIKSMALSTNLDRRRSSLLTAPTPVCASWLVAYTVYYTSLDCNRRSSLLSCVADLLNNLSIQSCSS